MIRELAVVAPPAAGNRVWIPLCVLVLAISGWLLFANLGAYCLWYDEADTALFAKGIARTGDMSAVIDHNIYAYHYGACLKNLRGRYQPPVPYYLAAPFVGADGTGSFWPRFPFAVCGLLSVGLLLFWMVRNGISTAAWIVLSLGLLGNVEFFLFCRQCRYFSLTILLSLVVVYLYMNWKGRWWEYAGIVAASILLLGSNYLSYAALYAALACDYLFFTGRQRKLNLKQWLTLLGPQVIAAIVMLWIFNPTGDEVAPDLPGRNIFLDKLLLLWWNIRDLNTSEFYVGVVMLAALPVWVWKRNTWLLRGMLAGFCYLAAVVIFSPQHVSLTTVANVRYLVPLIPLFVGLSALVILLVARHSWPAALVLGLMVFGSNALAHPFSPKMWRCRPVDFVEEVLFPQVTATGVGVDWINDNIHPGESIWVVPDYMTYGLMYHAPQAVYAWQLKSPPQKQFEGLSAIHFAQAVPVDYFIVFGAYNAQMGRIISMLKSQGFDYQLVKILDVYGEETTRPEIMLRLFRTIENYSRRLEAVYVYRLVARPSR